MSTHKLLLLFIISYISFYIAYEWIALPLQTSDFVLNDKSQRWEHLLTHYSTYKFKGSKLSQNVWQPLHQTHWDVRVIKSHKLSVLMLICQNSCCHHEPMYYL